MAEANGDQDNLSRLDRIERAIEHVMLLRSQVLLQHALEAQKLRMYETGGKLDALIDIVDRDHRAFHDRLTRLEQKQ